ncbi:MAG: UvrD-helicase domain-containing protein, partial [Acidimicrobiales bacterium]
LRLRDLARRDRVDEMTFELPLVGGDRPSGELTLAQVADVVAAHLPADDPMARYPPRLADPALVADLRGFLTGSLDLVVRVPGSGGQPPRFAVIDYKTNRLGPAAQLSAWHYRPEALAAAMQAAHYPLQALLYLVALHRYLRWRVAGYDPQQHLAGVLYLFVRGMVGPATPREAGTPCGVFAWHPPPALVVALSDLFDRGGGHR